MIALIERMGLIILIILLFVGGGSFVAKPSEQISIKTYNNGKWIATFNSVEEAVNRSKSNDAIRVRGYQYELDQINIYLSRTYTREVFISFTRIK